MTTVQLVSAAVTALITAGVLIFLFFVRRQLARAITTLREELKAEQAANSLYKGRELKGQYADFDRLTIGGYAKRDVGDLQGAIADFESALQSAPDHPDREAIRAEMNRLRETVKAK
jgi:regulator of sirC expression with transglutaminase-like and TPR domain